MQCSNPECRRIVKVPTPKAEKPKDWRELAKKGPTVAQMMQQEKIDDAAWGTQTDKVRAGSASLMEAGALPRRRPPRSACAAGGTASCGRPALSWRWSWQFFPPIGFASSAATRGLPPTCCATSSRARAASPRS